MIWTSIEVSVGVICANLPTLRPLALRLFPRLRSQRSHYAPTSEQKYYKNIDSSQAGSGGAEAYQSDSPHRIGLTTTVVAEHDGSSAQSEDVRLDNISIRKDLRMTSEIV